VKQIKLPPDDAEGNEAWSFSQGLHYSFVAKSTKHPILFERLVGAVPPSDRTASHNGAPAKTEGILFATFDTLRNTQSDRSGKSGKSDKGGKSGKGDEGGKSDEGSKGDIYAIGEFDAARKLVHGVFIIQHARRNTVARQNLDMVVVVPHADTKADTKAGKKAGNKAHTTTGKIDIAVTSTKRLAKAATPNSDVFFNCATGAISRLVRHQEEPPHGGDPGLSVLDALDIVQSRRAKTSAGKRQRDTATDGKPAENGQVQEEQEETEFVLPNDGPLTLTRFFDGHGSGALDAKGDVRHPCLRWQFRVAGSTTSEPTLRAVLDLGLTFGCPVPVVQRLRLSDLSPCQSTVEWFPQDTNLFPDNYVYNTRTCDKTAAAGSGKHDRTLSQTWISVAGPAKSLANTTDTSWTQAFNAVVLFNRPLCHGQPWAEVSLLLLDTAVKPPIPWGTFYGSTIDGVLVDGYVDRKLFRANSATGSTANPVFQRISCTNGWFSQSAAINVADAEECLAVDNGKILLGPDARQFADKWQAKKEEAEAASQTAKGDQTTRGTTSKTQDASLQGGGQTAKGGIALRGGDAQEAIWKLVADASDCAQQAVHLCTQGADGQAIAKDMAVRFARKLYEAATLLQTHAGAAWHKAEHQRLRELYGKYRDLLGKKLHDLLDPVLRSAL